MEWFIPELIIDNAIKWSLEVILLCRSDFFHCSSDKNQILLHFIQLNSWSRCAANILRFIAIFLSYHQTFLDRKISRLLSPRCILKIDIEIVTVVYVTHHYDELCRITVLNMKINLKKLNPYIMLTFNINVHNLWSSMLNLWFFTFLSHSFFLLIWVQTLVTWLRPWHSGHYFRALTGRDPASPKKQRNINS